MRVGNIICGIHVGNMPPEKTRHSTELFATKVMPHLKGIWKDYDSDEQFWIHPLPQRAVPQRTSSKSCAKRSALYSGALRLAHRFGWMPNHRRR